MDVRFHIQGFSADPASNASKILSNSIRGGGAESGAGYCADTTLRLDSPCSSNPFFSASNGIKRKWSLIDGSMDQRVGLPLSLGLGHSSSSLDSKGSSATGCTTTSSAKETDEESSMDLELNFSLHLGSEKMPKHKKFMSSNMSRYDMQQKDDLELSLSSLPAESDITAVYPSSTVSQNVKNPLTVGGDFLMDEGATSSRWITGNSFPPMQSSLNTMKHFLSQEPRKIIATPISPDLSPSLITTPNSSVTCPSGTTQQQPQRNSSTKICQFKGCGKGARGASGLCIAHGGGRRCQKPNCHKGAEGRTAYCKAHGGGRRCEFLGCTKSAEGRTDYCIAHGGGRRCSHEGCSRAARGRSGLCIRHGGGKRCQMENCTKSAEGLSGLCISHGGGRRCQYTACTKGAQGSTMFCKAHGGGKRCTFEGCNKGAEGSTPYCKGHGGGKRCAFEGGGICPKSVHGGTLFCVAHGGGKRCTVAECTKSARGRTDFCVRHGGGKRCRSDGCGKSAQGSTDFCKAHGGGKRCSWGHPGSEFGKGDDLCNLFARGKNGLCTSHGACVKDKQVHGGANWGNVAQDSKLKKTEKMKETVTMKAKSNDITLDGLIGSDRNQFGFLQGSLPVGRGSFPVPVPVSVQDSKLRKSEKMKETVTMKDKSIDVMMDITSSGLIGSGWKQLGFLQENLAVGCGPVLVRVPVPDEDPEGRVHGRGLWLLC